MGEGAGCSVHGAAAHGAPATPHGTAVKPAAGHEPPRAAAPHADRDEPAKKATDVPAKAPARDERADVPRLGPFVPGLDSVVIPAPMDDVDGTRD